VEDEDNHYLPTTNGIQCRNVNQRQLATGATRDTEKPERFREGD